MTEKQKRRIRWSRDAVLFTVGIAGIIYETVVHDIERPTLLLLFAGMVGVTQFLRTDEKRGGDDQ